MNEIPNLNASTVDGVVPLVVHGSNPGESCGEGSLVTLQNGLRDRGIEDFVCYDIYGDPLDPRQLVDCAVGIITAIQKGDYYNKYCKYTNDGLEFLLYKEKTLY